MLVKNIYRVARARKLFTAHRAGWSAADDRNICHVRVSLTASNSVAGMRNPLAGRPCLLGRSSDWKNNQTKTREEYSTEESRRHGRPRTLSDNCHTGALKHAEQREIWCEQHEEDFIAVEEENSGEERGPCRQPECQGQAETRFGRSRRGRPEQ